MVVTRRTTLTGIGIIAAGGYWTNRETVNTHIETNLPESNVSQSKASSTDDSTASEPPIPSPDVRSDGIARQGSWLGLDQETVELAAHETVNEHRSPIKYSGQLARIARYHSWDMARRNYYSHESPDGDSAKDRYKRFGYDCDWGAAENIVKTWAFTDIKGPDGNTVQYTSAEELGRGIVEEWLNSPDHKDILMKSDWSVEGIGVWWVKDKTYGGVRVYATQNFC